MDVDVNTSILYDYSIDEYSFSDEYTLGPPPPYQQTNLAFLFFNCKNCCTKT